MLSILLGFPLQLVACALVFCGSLPHRASRTAVCLLVIYLACALPVVFIVAQLFGGIPALYFSLEGAGASVALQSASLLTSAFYFASCATVLVVSLRLGTEAGWLECLVAGTLSYLLQHVCSDVIQVLGWTLRLAGIFPGPQPELLLQLAVDAVLCLLVWWLIGRRLVIDRERTSGKVGWVVGCMAVLYAAIVVNLVLDKLSLQPSARLASLLYDVVLSLLVMALLLLVSRKDVIQGELDLMRRQDEMRLHHLELLKRDFANIDEAMHDLKEAARALASMGEEGTRAIDRVAVNRADQIDRAVQSFNAMAHTGNPSIDVLLSEQNLRCQSNGVSLNAMVDGSALWFMDAPSIYAFFGNLLDAAIGMAEGVTDQFRRAVTLDVRTRGSMVAVTLTGCYVGVALRSDSLLLRSAGRVANRYRGELSVQASGGVLSVGAFLTPPDKG